MKKKVILFTMMFMVMSAYAFGETKKPWWKEFSAFPGPDKAPRIMPDQVKRMLQSGEKMVFVYAGYDVEKVLCGSVYVPYTLVPPETDGSRVNLKVFPKDIWIMCY